MGHANRGGSRWVLSGAGWRIDGSRCAESGSLTVNAFMKAYAVRLAAALALAAAGAPLPAASQYFPPALIIVPPPAQNYPVPKPTPKPPDKPKPTAGAPPPAKPAGHYQGQTFVPD
jgi:hypothetical protein